MRWCTLLVLFLTAAIRQLCVGVSHKERQFRCLWSRLTGQKNCSPCAQYYVFNRTVGYKRCEHINGRCLPFRTVFASARECESTCQPFIVRPTFHVVTTPKPLPIVEYEDDDY